MVYECENCRKQWYYAVKQCIFCNGAVVEKEARKSTVRGFTRIEIPSPGHSRVPYCDLLLEDEHGNFQIRKSFTEYKLGDVIEERPKELKKETRRKTVGIVGAGTMGGGIAQVCAQAGYQVIMIDRHEDVARKAFAKIDTALSKTTKDDVRREILGRIKISANLYDMEHADLVIEALTEDMELKKEVFKELDRECVKDTIFASNTSSLSIETLSQSLKDPGRLVGLHFFNPVPKMKLVEVIKSENTTEKTVEFAKDIALEIGKIPVVTGDAPGFIVNRLLLPFLNEAMDKFADGTSTAEDIDKAVTLGLNHPMGPLALSDLIGLDVCKAILDVLYQDYEDPKYKPCKTLCDLVEKGDLGRKAGKGFYTYK
ncbi:MAG: 3-hydroxyacyl-CoA dehydrogenase NAD-binding domain-containing protein [Candidatus Brocadiaceae bacterium]|nr:3-hydroxyacyl-CoA dehydrogenase NAD-binding domain-containing protein [Candidatus Brocadiaceae bacterium]